ncbi:MAG: SH3 domain-containing protein [Thermomicrobiales bacterium]
MSWAARTQRTTKRIGVVPRLVQPGVAFALVAALAVGVLAPLASPARIAAQAIDFAPGDTVVVNTDALNMRTGPGTATTVTDVLVTGTVGTVTDGPVVGPDWTWFEINVAGVGTGWVAGEYLALSGSPGGAFPVGANVFVDTDALNFREGPGTDEGVIAVLPNGRQGTINDGPVSADGFDWYELLTGLGGDSLTAGWVAGDFLALADDGSTEFPIGAIVAVNTDLLNVRANPGLGGRVVDRIGFGATGEVSRDPVVADGYVWYRLRLPNAADGWVAGEFLVEA